MSSRRKSFFQKCNETFLKMDLFANGEFLKYKGEGTYQTYTGSIMSVIIVTFFVIVFFNYCKQTINREKITNTPKQRPSHQSTFRTNESSSTFMFAVGLEGIDLTAKNRLFDIFLTSKVYLSGKQNSSIDIPMQPCLPQQWENINSQFKKIYSRLNFSQWLCPPKDYNFTFKGKYTSQEYWLTRLTVRRCHPDLGSCASDMDFTSALLAQQTFKLSLYVANPVIDASQKQYLDYVLEDTNYFEFTDMVGVSSHIFFNEYEVNTDNSIFPEPLTDVVTERGLTLTERPVVSNFEIINTDEYVRIYLRKADLIQQFDRSYTRLDVTFAYLGGLFGIAMILFYGMKAFSEYAYEFQIGSNLFVYNDKERSQFESSKFHIFRFPIYLLYCIVTFFYQGAENWSCFEFQRKLDECRDEVKEQTDVSFIMKRIIYIEKAIELNFKQQLYKIKLDNRWTIDQARVKRKFYDSHDRVRDLIMTSQKKASAATITNKKAMKDPFNEHIEQPIFIGNPPENQLHLAEQKRDEIVVIPQLNSDLPVDENEIAAHVVQRQEEPHSQQELGLRQRSNNQNLRKNSPPSKKSSDKERESSKSSNDKILISAENKENVQISHFNLTTNNREPDQRQKERKK